MTKLLFRFFIICIFFTVALSLLILYIYNIIDSKNSLENIKLITQGTFYSLDEYLKPYPPKKWQTLLNTLHPVNSGIINVVPLEELPLDKNQINALNQNEIIFSKNETEHYPFYVYKNTSNASYVYQYLLDFNDNERAQRLFGWSPELVTLKLRQIPEQQWPIFLKSISRQYGFPVSISGLDDLKLEPEQKQNLLAREWVINYPNKTDDSIQTLYTPLPISAQKKILIFGPIKLPLIGVYQKYILFIAALVIIECIIFILALLFARSLEKLKNLADGYGEGNFKNQITLSKTSTLYPLFNNLQRMGKRIQTLIASHKELTNAVSHELRTPISRLRFSLEFLKEAKDKQQIALRVSEMENDIEELEELVSEVLTYSQFDRKEIFSENERLSLVELLEFAVGKFNLICTKLLVLDFDNLNEVMIKTNKKYFLRMLQNLLQNANRFAKSTIKLSAKKTDLSHCQLVVEDDGPGIPDEDKERVFQPFIQLDNLSDHQSNIKEGYGLGLAITKKIVVQQGWDIVIEESKLGGAKMIVSITTQEGLIEFKS